MTFEVEKDDGKVTVIIDDDYSVHCSPEHFNSLANDLASRIEAAEAGTTIVIKKLDEYHPDRP